MFTKSITTLALASAFALTSCSDKKEDPAGEAKPNAPRKVETTTVTRSNMRSVLSLVGSIEANEIADIRAEISGNLESINFKEGDQVRAGQILAKVDDREIAAQLEETEAQLTLAKQTRARNENLVKSRAIPQAELDEAVSKQATLEATAQRLRVRLSKTSIKAPFDGTVGARNVSPGDYIDPTKSITTVVDTSRLKISFKVPERYYGQLKVGGKIDIRTSSTNNTKTTGSIYFISSVVERATRSAQVKAWIENPPKTLYPGMFTNVDLILEIREKILTVPEQALLASTRGDSLIVVGPEEGGSHSISIVPVKTGLREIGTVEIEPVKPDSIKEGTEVIAAGLGGLPLFPDMRVIPVPMRPTPIRTGSKLQTGSYDEILDPDKKHTDADKKPKNGN